MALASAAVEKRIFIGRNWGSLDGVAAGCGPPCAHSPAALAVLLRQITNDAGRPTKVPTTKCELRLRLSLSAVSAPFLTARVLIAATSPRAGSDPKRWEVRIAWQ